MNKETTILFLITLVWLTKLSIQQSKIKDRTMFNTSMIKRIIDIMNLLLGNKSK